MRKDVLGSVYLLHFSKPYQHARHYLGWSEFPEKRINQHRRGTSRQPLLLAAKRDGVKFITARFWHGVTRHFESRLKDLKYGHRICPICNPRALNLAKNDDIFAGEY